MADLPAPTNPGKQLAYALDWTFFYGNDRPSIAGVVNTYIIWSAFFGNTAEGLVDLDLCIADAVASGKTVIFMPNLSPPDGVMTPDALASLDVAAPYWADIDGVAFDEPGGSSCTKSFVEGLLASWAMALSDRTLATVPVYVDFTGPALRNSAPDAGKLAVGIDVMGCEAYLDPSLQNNPDVVALMTAETQALLGLIDGTSPGRNKFIFLQGYNRNGLWTNMESLRNVQAPPYLVGYNDDTVVAFWIFSWERPGGTQELPDCIRTEHERIWGAINGSPQPTTISCSSPPPFHSTRRLHLVRREFGSGMGAHDRYFISTYAADDLSYVRELFTIDAGIAALDAYAPINIAEGPLTPTSAFGRLAFFSGPTSGNALIYIYEPDGTFVRSFDSGCTKPMWIGYASNGTIYISEDTLNGGSADQLQQFTEMGALIRSWTIDAAAILQSFLVAGAAPLGIELFWVNGFDFPSQVNDYNLSTDAPLSPVALTFQPEWLQLRLPDFKLTATTWFGRVFHAFTNTGTGLETYDSTAIQDYFTQGQMKGRFIWLTTPSLNDSEGNGVVIRVTKCDPNIALASLSTRTLDPFTEGGLFLVTGPNEVILPCPGPPPTGTVYAMRRLRRFSLPFDENKMIFLSRIEFICQTGIGNADSPDPILWMRLSKDGGQTYGPMQQMAMGQVGEYFKRVFLNRLGRGRNWICEISTMSPNAVGLMDCIVEASEGSS